MKLIRTLLATAFLSATLFWSAPAAHACAPEEG